MNKKFLICLVVTVIAIIALAFLLLNNTKTKMVSKLDDIQQMEVLNENNIYAIVSADTSISNSNNVEFIKENENVVEVKVEKDTEQKQETVSNETNKKITEENKSQVNSNNSITTVKVTTNLTQTKTETTKEDNSQKQEQKEENNTKENNNKTEENKNETKEENNKVQDNKAKAKQKMLNSISYPTNTYRKNGNIEYKFNKSEALRVANAIIDESFNYDKFWNGTELLYKIKFIYDKEIMEYSMYFPYRETAIKSATKNKRQNGTFMIWAEDYYNDGEKIRTQYCIR